MQDTKESSALRNVVEIHQSNDRSIKEIADLAGISVAATKSRLLRARKILRVALIEGRKVHCHIPHENH
jgi:DNA-directed RNA polymerase specialized sigma24 family protein